MAIVSKYPLNGNANDSAGSNNGTASNVTWVNQGYNGAASFNGTNSEITMGTTGLPSGNQDITLYAIIQPGYTQDRIIYKIGPNSSNNQLGISLHTANEIKGYIFGGPNILSGVIATKRHFIGLSKTGNNFSINVDGVPKQTVTHTTMNLSLSGHQIGSGFNFFNGIIDEVEVHNTGLNTAQFKNKYLFYNGFI